MNKIRPSLADERLFLMAATPAAVDVVTVGGGAAEGRMKSNKMSTYVLVHGSWHDGSAWNDVAKLLEAAGHIVHTPTLAGHGPGADRGVSHAEVIHSLGDYMKVNDLKEVVLVGHSFGGSVLQRVAEEVPARIRQLIFACAYVLLDGESMEDNLPEAVRKLVASTVEPDGGVPMAFELFRFGLFNDGSEEEAARAYERIHPTPRRTLSDRVPIRSFFALEIPKSFIHFKDDTSIPADSDYYLLARQAPRLGKHRLLEISDGHEALFTNPTGLAEAILESSIDSRS